ncbi:MAG: HAMP domain-containing sensor histidine kinase [Calditrichia bacterium]
MKKRIGFLHPILVFIMAQLAWLSLLGLWIYWYVSNYIILKQVGDNLSPQIITKGANLLALIIGLIMLVLLLWGMYLIFIFLNRQINVTRFYDNFIANFTHELKSPLATIQLYLETLNLRKVSAEKQEEFIRLMLKDTYRLKNLINSILDMNVLEQQKAALRYQVYEAGDMVTDLIKESAEKFNLLESSVKISGNGSCECVFDRANMKTVFDNLIDNAIKYTEGEFELAVRMRCNEKFFYVELTDRGIGIPAKYQKRLFNKFFRVYQADSPNVKGTGLGLYMAREIMKHHNGKISVFSKGKNLGTTFRLQFPIFGRTGNRYLKQLLKKTQKYEKEQDAGHGE